MMDEDEQEREASERLAREEADLAELNEELRLDLAQAALDVAGIVDPTPITDVTGAALSLYRGDLIGAGLSLISAIPYAGDALAKAAKGTRLAKKIKDLKTKIEVAMAAVKSAKEAKTAAKEAKQVKKGVDEAVEGQIKTPCGKSIWSKGRPKDPVKNAYGHWKKHKKDFPELENSKQYVEKTKEFISNPPKGTLKKVRDDGEVVLYHPESNTLVVVTKDGTPKTMFKPDPIEHGYPSNLDYFNAQ